MIPITDRVVDPAVLDRAVAHFRSRGIILPTFAEQRDPQRIPGKIKDKLRGHRPLGPAPAQPFPHHLEERAQGEGRPLQRRQFPGASRGADRGRGAHRAAHRQVVPHRRPQGRRRLRLPGAAPGQRPVRPHLPQGGLALDRELLPRRRLRLRPAGLHGGRHPARGHEPRALRVARRRSAREVIATPGTESNVKEIYDKCWEIRSHRGPTASSSTSSRSSATPAGTITMTGGAVEEVFRAIAGPASALGAYVSSTGSAGTIAAGDYLRGRFPAAQGRGHRGAAVPHPAAERLRRPPHRGHRRQARPLGAQRAQHRHGGRHRRRGLHAPVAALQRARRQGAPGRPGHGPRAGRCSCRFWASPASANVLAAIKAAKYFEMSGRRRHLRAADRFHGPVRLAPGGAARGARPLHFPAGRLRPRALPVGPERGPFKELTHGDRKACIT